MNYLEKISKNSLLQGMRIFAQKYGFLFKQNTKINTFFLSIIFFMKFAAHK